MQKKFKGVLEPDGSKLGWMVVRVPFDPLEMWPKRKGLRVKGTLKRAGDSESSLATFRTSLFGQTPSDSQDSGHMLLVNKQVQKAAGIGLGSLVEISIEPDLEERVASLPNELAKLLKADRAVKKWYEQLSYSARHDIELTINQPKSSEARTRRAEQLVERIMLTMEGERELPPILHSAFQREPQARLGWEAMTPIQRRSQLMAIYYYQSIDARARRADKVVAEALQIANKAKLVPSRRDA